MDDLNARMPQIRATTRAVADLADVYADASPDLWDGLDNGVATVRTLNDQQENIDAALMAAIGFSNTAADRLERGGPYFVRAAEDLLPTTEPAAGERPRQSRGTPRLLAEVAKDLWPMPDLVMDTGYSIAPYNHFEIATPWTSEYIWGRQVGENTINP